MTYLLISGMSIFQSALIFLWITVATMAISSLTIHHQSIINPPVHHSKKSFQDLSRFCSETSGGFSPPPLCRSLRALMKASGSASKSFAQRFRFFSRPPSASNNSWDAWHWCSSGFSCCKIHTRPCDNRSSSLWVYEHITTVTTVEFASKTWEGLCYTSASTELTPPWVMLILLLHSPARHLCAPETVSYTFQKRTSIHHDRNKNVLCRLVASCSFIPALKQIHSACIRVYCIHLIIYTYVKKEKIYHITHSAYISLSNLPSSVHRTTGSFPHKLHQIKFWMLRKAHDFMFICRTSMNPLSLPLLRDNDKAACNSNIYIYIV